MIKWVDPMNFGSQVKVFAMNGNEIVGWVAKVESGYIIDTWNSVPPPHGPFETLEQAQLAAELMFE